MSVSPGSVGALVPLRFSRSTSALLRRAPGGKHGAERLEQRPDVSQANAIIDGASLAPRDHQPLPAKHAEMLRQVRRRDADIPGKLSRRQLAIDEAAQHHQPMPVGERAQKRPGLARARPQSSDLADSDRHIGRIWLFNFPATGGPGPAGERQQRPRGGTTHATLRISKILAPILWLRRGIRRPQCKSRSCHYLWLQTRSS